jgi:hypothetical protein
MDFSHTESDLSSNNLHHLKEASNTDDVFLEILLSCSKIEQQGTITEKLILEQV